MIIIKDKVVFGMAVMRLLSSSIELTAALMILKFDSIQTALKINAGLALVGPTIMALVMIIGLTGLSGKIPLSNFAIIILGVALIFYGIGRGS